MKMKGIWNLFSCHSVKRVRFLKIFRDGELSAHSIYYWRTKTSSDLVSPIMKSNQNPATVPRDPYNPEVPPWSGPMIWFYLLRLSSSFNHLWSHELLVFPEPSRHIPASQNLRGYPFFLQYLNISLMSFKSLLKCHFLNEAYFYHPT